MVLWINNCIRFLDSGLWSFHMNLKSWFNLGFRESKLQTFLPPFLFHHGRDSIHKPFFANPHLPVLANYIPHLPRPAINWYWRPTRTERNIRHLRWNTGELHYLVFTWCFRLLSKKSTSSTVGGFSGLLCSWTTYPAPEKSRSQSQNLRLTYAVQASDPTRIRVRHSTLISIRFIQIVRVTRQAQTLAKITHTTSLFVVEGSKMSENTTQSLIHNIIQRRTQLLAVIL